MSTTTDPTARASAQAPAVSSAADPWLLTYEGFDPNQEGLREALCTLGNGFFATRGAAPEATADGVHYPGTYVSGVYNRLVTEVSGRMVENESLVNVPNWLPLDFRAGDGPWFGESGAEVLSHHVELDMHRGVLTRRSELRDPDGHVLGVTQRRVVSMADPHLAALETTLVPVNWSGRLEVRSALDGTVRNCGVERYRELDDVHLTPLDTHRAGDEVICLTVETNDSHVRIAEAARTRLFRNGEPVATDLEIEQREGFVAQRSALDVAAGEEIVVEKVVSLFTSRDAGISSPDRDACDWVCSLPDHFDSLLERHALRWHHRWRSVDFDLEHDGEIARVLHLHLFHLLQVVPNDVVGLDVGIPARGLHGEAYRGHIFWDELFILPSLVLRLPALARKVLLYRYRRLDQARRAAREAGYAGAMFPWQSASNGREETQTMHLNPKSGRWLPDASHLQRHVNAAIVYNVWQYHRATGDMRFLSSFGAEIVLEIARFWSSAATYNRALDRYEINGVMGPDEYHERYPDRDEPGLDNNAYTNVMAAWCLCRAFDVLETLPPAARDELQQRLELSERELVRWNEVSRKLRVCFHDGVISQFEGFEDLEELDWGAYRERYGDIARLDRLLEAEGDTPNRYKLAKQADVLMLFYLLEPEDVASLLERLGYEVDDDLLERNLRYYEPRTAHGSTLSRVVHSWVLARRDRARSWDLFVEALYSDIEDIQGGTTKEGIHLGAMAGTVDLVQRCYTGLRARRAYLQLDPVIPPELGRLGFSIRYQGHLLHLDLATDQVRVNLDPADHGLPITLRIRGEDRVLGPGQSVEVALEDEAADAQPAP